MTAILLLVGTEVGTKVHIFAASYKSDLSGFIFAFTIMAALAVHLIT